MDFDKLYQLAKENIFTDLSLILTDDSNKININVHKNILYSSCVYFEKLLTNMKEKDANNIIIHVPNAYIAHDIILSFYNQKTNIANYPVWKYILESVKCYDFFGIEYDSNLIHDLKIPEEGFELLLDVIEIVGYNEKTIKLLNKNLPKEYDLSKFPKELLEEMLELEKSYNIISGDSHGKIKLWNMENRKPDRIINAHDNRISSVCCSFDYKQIASASGDKTIKIWDTENGELIYTLRGHRGWAVIVCYSQDNKQIASGSDDKTIKIWNTDNGQLINTLIGHTLSVKSVCYSPDNKQIASGSYDRNIKIWNSENYQLIHTLVGHNRCVNSISYSPNNKYLASASDDHSIKIWNSRKRRTYAYIEWK